MLYNYIKALHIIFVVTWFSGMFYIVRLFIYNTEAASKSAPAGEILRDQFTIMIRRLWWGITWPSAILTLIFGGWMWYLLGNTPQWLLVKLHFVAGLFLYHLSLHYLYRQQMSGIFKYSSQKLRIWNEVATLFLVAIVMLAVVKESMSWVRGIAGLILLGVVLIVAIKIYKKVRK
jgi:protoporphyrinogen IX oxidase